MKRRTAIRNVVLLSAGAATLLYSCKEKGATVILRNFQITGAEEDVLAELTETIIPSTPDFIGAKDINSAGFVLTMADDCMPPEEQQKFIAGLKAFDKSGFVKMSPEEKKDFIDKLEGDGKFFYDMVRQTTIFNFTTSKEYLEKVRNITTLIPPKFQACITVNS